MPDLAWRSLLDQVLSRIEPNGERRALLIERMRERGDLSLMYACFRHGGDTREIGRVLSRLAKDAKSNDSLRERG